jgi:hypothetical protein
MRDSTAIPTTELIKLVTAMTASSRPSVSGDIGIAAMTSMPSAEAPVESTYQRLGLREMSTSGAQIHFSHCVSRLAPLSSAPSAIDRPCCVAKNVRATLTKPPSAPNGR